MDPLGGWGGKVVAANGVYNDIQDMVENGVNFSNSASLVLNLASFFFACFTGEMLLRCEEGKKRADAIGEGDLLWSRSEFDADGPLMLKRVVRRFERTAKIWQVRVAGQVLRTTLEHPFWVENRQAWLPVGELRVGDVVRTEEGALLAVEGIEDSGSWEKVYNWEVEDYHTYFVSASEDGPSIWAHNAKKCVGGSEEESTVAGSLPKGGAAASGGAAKAPRNNDWIPPGPGSQPGLKPSQGTPSTPKGPNDIAFGLTRAQREDLVASRPERYRKGVVQEVWDNAKDPITGKVYDPNTLEEIQWDKSMNRNGQWDMGHLKGKSYEQLKQDFLEGRISRQQFLDEYNNPANYRPEAPSANRSRRFQ